MDTATSTSGKIFSGLRCEKVAKYDDYHACVANAVWNEMCL